eukprot:CAMPEP_0171325104 /NCGR_PEP_ID=MMETSP0816-20121228/116602_1 /TAXON_ID=420281 /ORGANISM="Proboscia inermis, Strain CCAP1064/1" /LENGTH=128 /DNA_ID=CAMNT_0011824199 /DNA_START=639 /DNA_END=1026 /DNA_ORIENTATION=-
MDTRKYPHRDARDGDAGPNPHRGSWDRDEDRSSGSTTIPLKIDRPDIQRQWGTGTGNQIPIMDLEMRTETGTIDEKETGAGYQIPKVIQELWRRGRGERNSQAGDGNEDYTPIVALGTGDQIPNYGDK